VSILASLVGVILLLARWVGNRERVTTPIPLTGRCSTEPLFDRSV